MYIFTVNYNFRHSLCTLLCPRPVSAERIYSLVREDICILPCYSVTGNNEMRCCGRAPEGGSCR